MKIIINTPQNPLPPMKSRFPYHFHFDVWALLLLAVELSANIVWMTCPPEPDPFRVESAMPVLDGVASVVRMLMLGTLILLVRNDAPERMSRPWKMVTLLLVAVYLGAWVALYHGFAGLPTILMLSVAPCCSFATFAIGRRNWLALCLTALFLAGHLISSLATFA